MKNICQLLIVLLGGLFILASCNSTNEEPISEVDEDEALGSAEDIQSLFNPEEEPTMYTYTVYRSTNNAMDLVGETLESEIDFTPYPEDKDALEETVLFLYEELQRPSKTPDYASNIPDAVELLGASLDGNELTLDFSESVQEHVHGSTGEGLFIDSLAITYIDNLDEVETIFFSINGEKVDILSQMYVEEGISNTLEDFNNARSR